MAGWGSCEKAPSNAWQGMRAHTASGVAQLKSCSKRLPSVCMSLVEVQSRPLRNGRRHYDSQRGLSSVFAKAMADKRGQGERAEFTAGIHSGFFCTSFFSFRHCAKNVDARREAGHDVL